MMVAHLEPQVQFLGSALLFAGFILCRFTLLSFHFDSLFGLSARIVASACSLYDSVTVLTNVVAVIEKWDACSPIVIDADLLGLVLT